jgi:hypothetical protein
LWYRKGWVEHRGLSTWKTWDGDDWLFNFDAETAGCVAVLREQGLIKS